MKKHLKLFNFFATGLILSTLFFTSVFAMNNFNTNDTPSETTHPVTEAEYLSQITQYRSVFLKNMQLLQETTPFQKLIIRFYIECLFTLDYVPNVYTIMSNGTSTIPELHDLMSKKLEAYKSFCKKTDGREIILEEDEISRMGMAIYTELHKIYILPTIFSHFSSDEMFLKIIDDTVQKCINDLCGKYTFDLEKLFIKP